MGAGCWCKVPVTYPNSACPLRRDRRPRRTYSVEAIMATAGPNGPGPLMGSKKGWGGDSKGDVRRTVSGFPPAQLCLRVLSVTWKQSGLLTQDSEPTWHPSTHRPLLPPPFAHRWELSSRQPVCWLGGSLHGVRCSFASGLGRGSPGGKLQGGGSHVGKGNRQVWGSPGGEVPEWSDLGCPASLDLEEVPRK